MSGTGGARFRRQAGTGSMSGTRFWGRPMKGVPAQSSLATRECYLRVRLEILLAQDEYALGSGTDFFGGWSCRRDQSMEMLLEARSPCHARWQVAAARLHSSEHLTTRQSHDRCARSLCSRERTCLARITSP